MTDRVIRILRDSIDELADEDIKPDTALVEGGFIDSFDIINLISVLESKFNVDIPLQGLNLADFETPASISSFLGQLTPAA